MMAQSFVGDYGAEQQAIDRRRKIAEMLMQQGQEQPQGGMVGQVYVGASPLQHMAQLLKARSGMEGMRAADEQSRALAGQRQAALKSTMDQMSAAPDQAALIKALSGNADTLPYAMQAQMQANSPQGREAALKIKQAEEQQALWKLLTPGGQPSGQAPQPGGMPAGQPGMAAPGQVAQANGFQVTPELAARFQAAGIDPSKLSAVANAGKQKVASWQKVRGPDGGPANQAFDEFGSPIGQPVSDAVKMHMVNLGDRQFPINEYTQTAPLTINQSPDSKASTAVVMRGQNMTDARSRDLAALKREELAQGKAPTGYRMLPDGSLKFIPGGPADPSTKSGGPPSEDERKGASWLIQAGAAFDNMQKVLAKDPEATKPGFIESLPMIPEMAKNKTRSEDRQMFNQAASSFGEAVLRAATGAGVNKDEAAQKAQELTPQWGDKPGVIAQKRAGAELYLKSLEQRAGRAAPGALETLSARGMQSPPKINSAAERDALPPGAQYIAPDGSLRTKQ